MRLKTERATRKALVVGGGIAGSAASWWLHRTGWDVVLVDDNATPPSGGFVLDLDSTAQKILQDMGASDVIGRTSFVSPATTVRLTKGRRPLQVTFSGDGSRLAHRARLIEELQAHVPKGVDMRLGRRLESLQHRAHDVVAHLDDGTAESFEIVVGADGLHSTVRNLVFSSHEASFYRNGLSHVWMTLPRGMDKPEALVIGRRRAVVFAYPYPSGNLTQIVAALPAPDNARNDQALVGRVAGALRSMGGELAGVGDDVAAAPDALMTRFTQVRTKHWASRRVVLIGDAAHCIDPMSGLGAHGALLGAVTLAHELEQHDDITRAFAAYESTVRSFVESRQQLTTLAVEFVTHPRQRPRSLAGAAAEALKALPTTLHRRGRARLAGRADQRTAIS